MNRQKQQLSIVYNGPALSEHTMDISDLMPALLAVSELIKESGAEFGMDRRHIFVGVKAPFRTGSFGIDIEVTQTLFESLGFVKHITLGDICTYLGVVGGVPGLIGFVKWLRKRDIDGVEKKGKDRVSITAQGESIEIDAGVLQLYRNPAIQRSLKKAIHDPLGRDGVESFSITTNPDAGYTTVSWDEAAWFDSGLPEEMLVGEDILEKNLFVVSPSFQPGTKWRFSEGAAPFYAGVQDKAFLRRVGELQESFRANDVLTVRLRVRRYSGGERQYVEMDVMEVLYHESAPPPASVFVDARAPTNTVEEEAMDAYQGFGIVHRPGMERREMGRA
uniref:Uncharacterized protein n=1 Tax=Candidatus Kentrum sp. MB TaxID=2138164 RepID=A0A450XX58_9GAMM|nr:MAG: hypothetical protein BECKMB1821G_GA0114241_10521 [Candidatus Kentron sp. MB]VFK33827.1 MAG: hypothetical protein BECKMB1821I_GA0114274_10541 [Candidatus Kentron sp. MB]VFK76420.1 MAG: hypothetical protein BECKMB1821H_GA0114242_10561 [Candidatus Kentron sp. MB]